ncbi:MAG: TonB-dependent receptor, partial [Armatimonadetes bacterium]|nr:TonB-dependent receptor [Armatimonadota bacterium]
AGGRVAFRRGADPVARPEAYVRHRLSDDATLVLLTRPLLADDVSELSPVMDWSLRRWMSPRDLGPGGYSQSWELQYQLVPSGSSLLRVAAFYRQMENLVIDMADPAWAPGQVGLLVASGRLVGGEVEWERWIGHGLSAGIWVRYTDSEERASGQDLPYQPDWMARVRVDYLNESGTRVGVSWLHVGERWADLPNTIRLSSYDAVSLRAAQQLNLNTDVFVSVDNIFNERAGFWQGHPSRRTHVRGGVQYRF